MATDRQPFSRPAQRSESKARGQPIPMLPPFAAREAAYSAIGKAVGVDPTEALPDSLVFWQMVQKA